ncbi:isoprenoid synthase domain-containing protein [Apodospora peruviana]|uniref:Terpene synthase n=1 Tax=Apodospora peruviana TaxID=516989 RepID=A0AAE0MCF7_9PEZI|nr:isoprenoid synthase domain-containing protein [Apodospora peruviana]
MTSLAMEAPSNLLGKGGPTGTNNQNHLNLIAEIQGQAMHVPDIARTVCQLAAVCAYSDEKLLKRASKNDYALFTSIWFPEADWNRFAAVGVFFWWLFTIDDLMDMNEEDVSLDFAASCRFREQVTDYTRHWLCLESADDARHGAAASVARSFLSWVPFSFGVQHLPQAEPPSPDPRCSVFKEFGNAVVGSYSKVGFRQGLQKELEDYIAYCEVEQRDRLTGRTPDSLDEYMETRSYTSAVRVCCYIVQIAFGIELPMWLLQAPEMQILWKEININIIFGNDMLSIKKELVGGCVHNSIPILYHSGLTTPSRCHV